MKEYHALVVEAQEKNEPRPLIPDYVGECFMKIAQRLSFRPNFINYAFREEMISDGIENCVMYASNFDHEKSSNPFAYFTQITYYAFLRRIEKEKKQAYVKYKLTETTVSSDTYILEEDITGNVDVKVYENSSMDDFEQLLNRKRKSRRKKVTSLEEFME